MLFYGPPGTGKTSTILALAKELFGPELYRSRVLELNASDERGIAIVREKVKNFARQQLSNAPTNPTYRKKHPCPPFKIIILDEADSMTQDAQSALRRTMETYSRITRFCLVCNYVSRIIDPLASRCSKFRFKSLDQGHAVDRLELIAREENVRLAPGAVDALVSCADGDLRKAITYLQSAARLVGSTSKPAGGDGDGNTDAMDVDKDDESSSATQATGSAVTVDIVQELAGVIPDATIAGLMDAIYPDRATGSKTPPFGPILAIVTALAADGWSGSQVVSQLFKLMVQDERIPGPAKSRASLVFSEIDRRLVDGSDETLQMVDLAVRLGQCFAAA